MTATNSPIYRWRVGDVEIVRVLEFEAALFEPAVIYPEVSPEIMERHQTWLEPTLLDAASGRLVFAFHSMVIKAPRAAILVDTCSGNDKERPHKLRYHQKSWPYLANLAAAGFAPEDIDYVLCTHLHADHVGWNTRLLNGRWVPTFPNARYLFARQEWEHWRVAQLRASYTTDPYYEDSLLPVMESGQAELVAMDYAFDDSVSSRGPGTPLVTSASWCGRRAPLWSSVATSCIRRCSVPSRSSTAASVWTRRRRERRGGVFSRPSPIPRSWLCPHISPPRLRDGYARIADHFASISTASAEPALGDAQRPYWPRSCSALALH